jgi:membrane protease YdiL (CAAX protease family)
VPQEVAMMAQNSSADLRPALWQRVPLAIRAVAIGLLVMVVGVQTWNAVAMFALRAGQPAIPLVAGPVILVVYWLFFSGARLGPGAGIWPATQAARRENFRETSLSPARWGWGLAGGLLFVVVFQSSVFTVFRLFPYPAAQFTPPQYVAEIPPAFRWPYVVLASLVAGICEETGFRGYMQRPLEARYGAVPAIAITTLFFVGVHFDQTWIGALCGPAILASVILCLLAYAARSLIPSMIGHAVMDVFNFGYWWWQLLGHYDQRPIFETGIDANFVAWAGTLAISLSLFPLVIRKLRHASTRNMTPLPVS